LTAPGPKLVSTWRIQTSKT